MLRSPDTRLRDVPVESFSGMLLKQPAEMRAAHVDERSRRFETELLIVQVTFYELQRLLDFLRVRAAYERFRRLP